MWYIILPVINRKQIGDANENTWFRFSHMENTSPQKREFCLLGISPTAGQYLFSTTTLRKCQGGIEANL